MKFKVNLQVTGTIEPDDGPNPPDPPHKDWPNLPANFKKINEWDCSGDPAWTNDGGSYVDEPIDGSNGWRCAYNHTPGTMWPNDGSVFANTPMGWTECLPDSAGGKLYRFTYPEGMQEGNAPSTCYIAWGFAAGIRELYAGMWWKPDANFDLTNNGTKLAFMFNGGGGSGGQMFMCMAGSKQICVMPEYEPYNDPNVPYYIRYPNVDLREIELGEWHQLEWYVDLDKHIIRWWVDGVLTGDYDDLVPNNFNFDMYQLSPTYGGCCSHKRPYTCGYEFNEVILATLDTAKAGKVTAQKSMKFHKLPKDYKLPKDDPWPSSIHDRK